MFSAELAAGVSVIVVGIILFLWPQPVHWISDQTNLRAAKWKAAAGSEPARRWLENYPRIRRTLGRLVAAFVTLMGLVVMLGGFS
jgi:hypothetical protein